MPIGCKLTLRHPNLYRFIDRLINQVLPLLDVDINVDVDDGAAEGQMRPLGGRAAEDAHRHFDPCAREVRGESRGRALESPTSFGIGEKDFLTLLNDPSQASRDGQLDTLYGLDIIIVCGPAASSRRRTKNRCSTLSRKGSSPKAGLVSLKRSETWNFVESPKYMLSASQMPLAPAP